MTPEAAKRYYRNAKKWQGAFVSGWNPLADYAGIKPVRKVARHGDRYGNADVHTNPAGTTLKVEFDNYAATNSRPVDMEQIVYLAEKKVAAGFAGNAKRILSKKLSTK